MCLSSPSCKTRIIMFVLSVTCLFMLQTPQGKGCLFPYVWGCSGSQPKPSKPDLRKFFSRKDIYQTQHVPGGSTTNFFRHKKETQKERTATLATEHSLSCFWSMLGKQRDPGCHVLDSSGDWGILSFRCLTALAPGSLEAQPCWKGPQSLKTLDDQLGLSRVDAA